MAADKNHLSADASVVIAGASCAGPQSHMHYHMQLLHAITVAINRAKVTL